MAPKVCAPLVYISSHQCKVPEFIHVLLVARNLNYGERISFHGLPELEVKFISELRSLLRAAVQVWYRYRTEWAWRNACIYSSI